MDFKLISKNNIGGVATLFLVILLTQSRFFDFLIDTTLGRAILILFILGISYTNKILGVVAVLFIIILFNNSNIAYMEGFTSNVGETTNVVAVSASKEEKDESEKGTEGFNITEREDTMLRGKRSNEVQLFSDARNQDDDVEPTDKSVFTSSFSSV